ncbi:MAG: DUF3426 domain-containing protein [Pseudomonadota bacterium]
MFKPCPNCGFLVALIAGREASQRCPRCGSAMQDEGGPPPAADVPEQGATTHAAASHAQSAEATPSFAAGRRRAAPRRGRRWPWAIALPLLALLLAFQLLLSQRVELAQDARWRPLLLAACAALGCDVPAWREPRAYVMLARNVRPHPGRPGVLHVTASLRNGARWPQPLPVLVLSLSDIDGRVLAARAVAPRDYGRRPDALVDPGDSVDIAFDVREPSPRVVSFDFQLR